MEQQVFDAIKAELESIIPPSYSVKFGYKFIKGSDNQYHASQIIDCVYVQNDRNCIVTVICDADQLFNFKMFLEDFYDERFRNESK